MNTSEIVINNDIMKFNFQNKTVLITGGSRGVGAEAAQLFANAGARVALHYNQNKESAEAVLISLSGDNHQLFQADLVRKEAGVELVEQVIHAFGSIDIIVSQPLETRQIVDNQLINSF